MGFCMKGFLKKEKSIGLVIRGKCELAIFQYASDSYREDTQFSKLGFPHYSFFCTTYIVQQDLDGIVV